MGDDRAPTTAVFHRPLVQQRDVGPLHAAVRHPVHSGRRRRCVGVLVRAVACSPDSRPGLGGAEQEGSREVADEEVPCSDRAQHIRGRSSGEHSEAALWIET